MGPCLGSSRVPEPRDKGKIGSPQRENRDKNRAQNRDQQNGNMFNDFFKSSIQMGQE